MAFDPISLAVLAVSSAFSAVGAIQQSNAQQANYQQQADAQNRNAAILDQNATATRQAGARDAEKIARDQAIQRGQENANIAESGLGYGGSNANIVRQNNSFRELDLMNQAHDTELKARGLTIESGNARQEAKVAEYNKGQAAASGGLSVLSAGISGASNVYSQGKGLKIF
jgi:hypothetical protein